MTVHVSVRSISALLLLSVILRVILDAETGDVLETRQTMWSAEAGMAVAIPGSGR